MMRELLQSVTVYLVTGYSDLRQGIDGLATRVQGTLSLDPYSRSLFLFCFPFVFKDYTDFFAILCYGGLDQRTGQQVRPALTPEERYTQRQERTKPVLDAFYAWLDSFVPAGGTGLARACQYARNEKKYLYAFLHDPAITPDNNRAENAIRPFVVGRKNWLFSDSEKGAEAS